jgi:hypothetical protein
MEGAACMCRHVRVRGPHLLVDAGRVAEDVDGVGDDGQRTVLAVLVAQPVPATMEPLITHLKVACVRAYCSPLLPPLLPQCLR